MRVGLSAPPRIARRGCALMMVAALMMSEALMMLEALAPGRCALRVIEALVIGKMRDDDVFLGADGRQRCGHDGVVQPNTRAETEEVEDVDGAIEGQPRWCVEPVEVFHERLHRYSGPITFCKPADELLQLLMFTVRENVQICKEPGGFAHGAPYHGLF